MPMCMSLCEILDMVEGTCVYLFSSSIFCLFLLFFPFLSFVLFFSYYVLVIFLFLSISLEPFSYTPSSTFFLSFFSNGLRNGLSKGLGKG